jgi:hypothetical protein
MMRRLYVANDNISFLPWSVGAARYRVGHQTNEGPLVVAVRCRIDELGDEVDALLDTGAKWSVLGGAVAQRFLDETQALGEPTTMSTRLGRIRGHLQRMSITLLAEDGLDHPVAATVVATPEWDGPFVLGYSGMIERIRIALDPGISSADQWMYFGATG